MDSDWPSQFDVSPRDLELNYTVSTSSHVSQATSCNTIHSSIDPWLNVPALHADFVPATHAGPDLEMSHFDIGMSALDQVNFQNNDAIGPLGTKFRATNLGKGLY
jgi:hypothetical protein